MANRLAGNTNSRYSGRLWGQNNNESMSEIDLRQEFDDIMYGTSQTPQRGHWVVYRRFDISQTVSGVYDEVYRSGVGGPAHPYTDIVVMTRRDPIFSPESAETHTPMGQLEGSKDGYYFRYDFRPNQDDQIFEVDWDNHLVKPTLAQIPKPYLQKFNIKEPYAWRCDGGRVEFWIAFVHLDRVNY